MRLFLTADLHDNRAWLEWIVDQAHNYDLICIAGDLLDMFAADEGGQIDHLRGNWLPKMIATEVPLAVCSGNHDHGMNAWLNYIDVPGKVVGDGSTQLLSLSGAQLIVTTCPYYRAFNIRDSVMIELWERGARLRTETQALWLVLHHEPPAQICPPGYTATHWLSLRLRTYRPDYVSCGHLHVFWARLRLPRAWRMVPQLRSTIRRPSPQLHYFRCLRQDRDARSDGSGRRDLVVGGRPRFRLPRRALTSTNAFGIDTAHVGVARYGRLRQQFALE